MSSARIVIPPRGSLPKTYEDDPIVYYHRPLLGRLYRARLELACRLLGPGPFESLLEVGYGSGILFPELARRTRRLVGLDVHAREADVAESLRRLGVEAELHRGTLYAMPFAEGEFDALTCLSVFEHLTDLDGALDELRRVLHPGGVAVLGFPVRNPATDAFFRLVGYDPRELHPSGHKEILAAVRRHPAFELEREARLPGAYVACRARAR